MDDKQRQLESMTNDGPDDVDNDDDCNALPYDVSIFFPLSLFFSLKFEIIIGWLVVSFQFRSLTWFNNHRENEERRYCYCGKNGKWYMQMLQCARCLQWFHHGCMKSLTHPLYFGDRYDDNNKLLALHHHKPSYIVINIKSSFADFTCSLVPTAITVKNLCFVWR